MNRRSAVVILAAVPLAGLTAALAVLLTGGGEKEAAPAHTMPGGQAMTEPMADAAHEGMVVGAVGGGDEGGGRKSPPPPTRGRAEKRCPSRWRTPLTRAWSSGPSGWRTRAAAA